MTAVPTEPRRLPADPRPRVVREGGQHVLAGARCVACGHALARPTPRCSRCRGATEPECFGPEGVVWATTVVHVAARPGGEVPYRLAYVDLDDGPRILLRLQGAGEPAGIGDRVRLAAPSPGGDVIGEVVG